ncbi:MAG: hypothetical protein R6V62_01465 [Candidatus Fermentibacteraceae bacterium]
MNRIPSWIILSVSGLVLAITAIVTLPVLRADFRRTPESEAQVNPGGEVAARVGDAFLYREDMALMDLDEQDARDWYRDELLARAAIDEGLENPAVSRLVAHRARQVYLRDMMLEHIAASVDYPTEQEALAYMGQFPDEFLLERHFFHILLADSATADSVHSRLSGGDAFQITAQRVSLSQKAAIGGDLGFVTGGEIFLSGLPREAATLEGLSPVYRTPDGWHILMTSETRALPDSTRARVITALQGYLFSQRLEAAAESVVSAASGRYDCEVIQ